MIIKAVNVDGNNIVMSADVKQETEKSDNVRSFASTTRKYVLWISYRNRTEYCDKQGMLPKY